MKTRKLGVVLLALLLAAMAMVPVVNAQNNTTDINPLNHLDIHFENKNITNFIAYDITSKANLSSFNVSKPEELNIPSNINKFDVVTFNNTLLNDQLKSGKGIIVSFGERNYQTQLYPMKDENTSDGVYSFYGTLLGENNSDIQITTSKKVLIGYISLGNETFWIQPIEPRLRTEISQSPLHIIYSSNDERPTNFTYENQSETKGIGINAPEINLEKFSSLQTIPSDQPVYITILVVPDQQFWLYEPDWLATAHFIMNNASLILSRQDINVHLISLYNESRKNQFYSTPDELTLFKSIYPISYLDSFSAGFPCDIALYLGGYDHNDTTEGATWGFSNIEPDKRRYAWVQMVPDANDIYGGVNLGYTASDKARSCVVTHEIGHLFDAGHETRDAGEPQYARSTWWLDPVYRVSIMNSGYNDIAAAKEFSSYSSTYCVNNPGICHGDSTHDNARRIRETRDTVAGYEHNDKTGVYRPGTGFFLKMDQGSTWNPVTDVTLTWDNGPNDLPIAGDWNMDGRDETGVYRPGTGFFLKMDQGSTWNPVTDVTLTWDNGPNDLPIAGDWNMDGRDETGVYRPGAGFYLKMDQGSTWNPSTDLYLAWDNAAGDRPIAGDWNMDGRDETGVYRPGVGFYLKMDQGSTWYPATDMYLAWDNGATDLPIAGDWNGDGRDETGVYRPGTGFFLKMDQSSTWNPATDRYLNWDNVNGDLPIAGNFG